MKNISSRGFGGSRSEAGFSRSRVITPKNPAWRWISLINLFGIGKVLLVTQNHSFILPSIFQNLKIYSKWSE
jgi:hypothetical protein